ncbi:MAG: DUF5106 domain-containing protein [Duncaniella sp.]|nr:DUF5106 domain-containing protein [Duncaniella sp.]
MRIRNIFLLLSFLACTLGAKAEGLFPYPIVPDSISTLTGRCDFQARHFWDFCDLKKVFSTRARVADEFRGYLEILQLATPDSAVAAVESFTKRLEKQPNDLLFLAEIAEAELYSDTAKVWADELYIPFARAVVNNKKVQKPYKARFRQQAEVLGNSLPGHKIPSLPFTRPDGSQGDVAADSARVTLLFINDPDCSSCRMARVRLSADVNTRELVNDGVLKIFAITPADPDENWKEEVSAYPAEWTVGAAPDMDMTLDLRGDMPVFYILDKNNKIRFKHLDIDQVLDIMRQLKKR